MTKITSNLIPSISSQQRHWSPRQPRCPLSPSLPAMVGAGCPICPCRLHAIMARALVKVVEGISRRIEYDQFRLCERNASISCTQFALSDWNAAFRRRSSSGAICSFTLLHSILTNSQGGSTCLRTEKMADVRSSEGDYPVSADNLFSFLDEIIAHTLKFLPMKSLHTCAR